jgi:nucleotide-binding universal stress UspA family protein
MTARDGRKSVTFDSGFTPDRRRSCKGQHDLRRKSAMVESIVVGIDGSDDGQRALAWAVDEARQRGAVLEVVHAWELMASDTMSPDPAGNARAVLAQSLTKMDTEGIEVHQRLVEGRPVPSLLRAAAEADLLVVGSRGRSGVAAVILGSVSSSCLHYAACPVVVVPPARRSSMVGARNGQPVTGAGVLKEDQVPAIPGTVAFPARTSVS